MKKAIYLLAATALMVSCDQDVLVDNMTDAQPEVNRHIGFDTFVDKATRAEGTNSNALNDFYTTFIINGWKTVGETTTQVFENIEVKYCDGEDTKPSSEWGDNAEAGWYYENIRYWDKMATGYQFSAYAPATAKDDVDCTADGLITIGSEEKPITVESTNLMATPAEALAYTGFKRDYMTAQSTDKSVEDVSLTFAHLQAKLNIRIKLDEKITTAQNVSVERIEVHNLGDKGYYENTTGFGISGWKLTDPTTDYVPNVTTPYSLNAATNYHNYYVLEQLIIPQTIVKSSATIPSLDEYAEACIYVEYKIGEETFKNFSPLANIFIGTAEAESYDFKGGNQYTVNVTIGPDPIKFTAEVALWETEVKADHDID